MSFLERERFAPTLLLHRVVCYRVFIKYCVLYCELWKKHNFSDHPVLARFARRSVVMHSVFRVVGRVGTRQECQELCLLETEFQCQSAEYVYTTLECRLSR